MKINDSIKQSIDLVTDKAGVNASKKSEQASTMAPAKENVTLSTLSTQMKTLETKIANTEVFDAKKVDAIKSAITSGQFTVDSAKIAESLVTSVKDFLSTQR